MSTEAKPHMKVPRNDVLAVALKGQAQLLQTASVSTAAGVPGQTHAPTGSSQV